LFVGLCDRRLFSGIIFGLFFGKVFGLVFVTGVFGRARPPVKVARLKLLLVSSP
jgi:hypothetical protein